MLTARFASGSPPFADSTVEHLRTITQVLPAHPSNLFRGTTGTISTAHIVNAMTSDPRLQPLLRSGTARLSDQAESLAERYRAQRRDGDGHLAVEDYDAVSGLAGLGRMLLLGFHSGYSPAESGLEAALEALTGFLARSDDRMVGRRASPTRNSAWGEAQLGMAHGVAGPLAFLSIALSKGNYVEGQHEALRSTAEWLLAQHHAGTWSWPATADQGHPFGPPTVGHGWCTGSTGIATAIHLAGRALGERNFIDTSIAALAALGDTPRDRWAVSGPALCCGYSGVLQAALAVMSRDPDPRLTYLADTAAEGVLDYWNPSTSFGFPRFHRSVALNSPEFLDGASGIAPALYDYAHGACSSWSTLLLLR
ncbi:lanthionine synthetase LanC family protein [Streptomyces sp. NPDC056069]|uniref:lanthionine synthetase LanC family protein n=1 Tax=Streptomyces sp. NPDC056069 TaxID=3345702 RepID=UPI0035D724FC